MRGWKSNLCQVDRPIHTRLIAMTLEYYSPTSVTRDEAELVMRSHSASREDKMDALLSAIYFIEDEAFVAEFVMHNLRSGDMYIVENTLNVLVTFVQMRRCREGQLAILEIVADLVKRHPHLREHQDEVIGCYSVLERNGVPLN